MDRNVPRGEIPSKYLSPKQGKNLRSYFPQTKTPHNFHLLNQIRMIKKTFQVYINMKNKVQIFIIKKLIVSKLHRSL